MNINYKMMYLGYYIVPLEQLGTDIPATLSHWTNLGIDKKGFII